MILLCADGLQSKYFAALLGILSWRQFGGHEFKRVGLPLAG